MKERSILLVQKYTHVTYKSTQSLQFPFCFGLKYNEESFSLLCTALFMGERREWLHGLTLPPTSSTAPTHWRIMHFVFVLIFQFLVHFLNFLQKPGIIKLAWKAWVCESCLACLCLTGPYRSLPVLTGPYWAPLGLTGPYWALLGLT